MCTVHVFLRLFTRYLVSWQTFQAVTLLWERSCLTRDLSLVMAAKEPLFTGKSPSPVS